MANDTYQIRIGGGVTPGLTASLTGLRTQITGLSAVTGALGGRMASVLSLSGIGRALGGLTLLAATIRTSTAATETARERADEYTEALGGWREESGKLTGHVSSSFIPLMTDGLRLVTGLAKEFNGLIESSRTWRAALLPLPSLLDQIYKNRPARPVPENATTDPEAVKAARQTADLKIDELKLMVEQSKLREDAEQRELEIRGALLAQREVIDDKVALTKALAAAGWDAREVQLMNLKDGQELLRIEKELRKIQTDRLDAQRRQISSDWRLTDAQKFEKLKALNADEAALGPDPSSLADQMRAEWTALGNYIGTVQQNIARTFSGSIASSISSVSHGISGLILQTQTWSQVLQSIGTTVLHQVVDGMVKVFAAWVKGRFQSMTASIAASKAEGAADTAAKAPGAILTSISSYGVAAAIGLAAVVAALAAAGSFRKGGFTGSGPEDEIAGVVHGGEFVVPANRVAQFGPGFFEQIRQGTLTPQDFAMPQIVLPNLTGSREGGFAGTGATIAALASAGSFRDGGYAGAQGREFVVPSSLEDFGADHFQAVRHADIRPADRSSEPTGPVNVTTKLAVLDTRNALREFMEAEGNALVWDWGRQRGMVRRA